ncbi:hypothetical protein [Sphingopyxis sp. 550A]
MKFSLFTRWTVNGPLRFNPYVRIGGYELCIDRDGACIHTPSRSFGFIRGSGFWSASA